MKTQKNFSVSVSNSRSALKTYAMGAAVVYTCALAYCIYTQHYFETAIVGGVMAVLTTLIISSYGSLGKEGNNNEEVSKTQYRNAA